MGALCSLHAQSDACDPTVVARALWARSAWQWAAVMPKTCCRAESLRLCHDRRHSALAAKTNEKRTTPIHARNAQPAHSQPSHASSGPPTSPPWRPSTKCHYWVFAASAQSGRWCGRAATEAQRRTLLLNFARTAGRPILQTAHHHCWCQWLRQDGAHALASSPPLPALNRRATDHHRGAQVCFLRLPAS